MLFKYVNLWSSENTWGGEFAPVEGDSVFVPTGLNLLVDVDSTPVLNLFLSKELSFSLQMKTMLLITELSTLDTFL